MFVLLFAAVIGFVSCQDAQEVAFSAGLTHHQIIQHAENVVYDRIYSNIGAGYSSSTGIFTCPVSGFYVFQFHTLSRSGQSSWLELYHNSEYVSSIYGHNANDYSYGGNSVILQLKKGDQALPGFLPVMTPVHCKRLTAFPYETSVGDVDHQKHWQVKSYSGCRNCLAKVYVKAVDNSFGADTNLYGVTDEIYSTFTGYLVSAQPSGGSAVVG